jgi:hypothetical protein
MNWWQILVKIPNIKFYKNLPSGSRQTDMMELIATFCSSLQTLLKMRRHRIHFRHEAGLYPIYRWTLCVSCRTFTKTEETCSQCILAIVLQATFICTSFTEINIYYCDQKLNENCILCNAVFQLLVKDSCHGFMWNVVLTNEAVGWSDHGCMNITSGVKKMSLTTFMLNYCDLNFVTFGLL